MSEISRAVANTHSVCVKYTPVKTVADIGTGSSDRVNSDENGNYPFFVRSQKVLRSNRYLFEEDAIIIPGEGGIGDIFHFVSGKYDLHQRAYRIHFRDARILPKFAFYYFLAFFKKYIMMRAVNATVISIRKPMIGDFPIPIPPFEIQQEIVRILDSFTALTAELTAELKAELTARKKQYEFYRDKLLSFDGEDGKLRVKCLTLGDIGRVRMCKRIYQEQTQTKGDIPFFKIGTFGKEPDAYISKNTYDDFLKKYPFPKKGDVLISAAGTIGKAIKYGGEPAYFQDSNIVWIENDESLVLNEYLFHYYSLNPWSASSGGTIKRLYNDDIYRTIIRFPPIEVQKYIVPALDRFEALHADIAVGLPAEIEARRKQYEYYRDKLLTFNEVVPTESSE